MNGNKLLIVSVIALILSLKGSAIVLDLCCGQAFLECVKKSL